MNCKCISVRKTALRNVRGSLHSLILPSFRRLAGHMLDGMTTGISTNDPTVLFIHQMIPHHQNAVNVSVVALPCELHVACLLRLTHDVSFLRRWPNYS